MPSLASQDAVTAGATYTYGYDARKRLVSAGAVSGDAGTYGYDYRGRRVWRQVAGSSATVQTHYIFDEAGHLLAEHDGASGAVLREYVWLDDTPPGGASRVQSRDLAMDDPRRNRQGVHDALVE